MNTAAPTPAVVPFPSELAPLRSALLDDARREADSIVAEARRSAAELVAAAEHEADDALDRVRRRTAASARARAEQAREQARGAANVRMLRARAEVQRELADRVHDAVDDLARDPRYPALLDRLEQISREQLGCGAAVERDPAPGGGVIATAGGRRVDYRLPALADRALAAIADEVAALWS